MLSWKPRLARGKLAEHQPELLLITLELIRTPTCGEAWEHRSQRQLQASNHDKNVALAPRIRRSPPVPTSLRATSPPERRHRFHLPWPRCEVDRSPITAGAK